MRLGLHCSTYCTRALVASVHHNYHERLGTRRRAYHVWALGKLSVGWDSTRWIVNSLGPIAPVEPGGKRRTTTLIRVPSVQWGHTRDLGEP